MTTYVGHPGIPPGVPTAADFPIWWRKVAKVISTMLVGGLNNAGSVTLTANAATSTLTDVRIGGNTKVAFMAMTANAAAEAGGTAFYYDTVADGSLVIHHANNSQTDRTFSYLLGG